MKKTLFTANLAWFLSMVPRWFLFFVDSYFCRRKQAAIRQKIVNKNRLSKYIQSCAPGKKPINFSDQLPLVKYPDIEKHILSIMKYGTSPLTKEKVTLLEPTSGSSGRPRLIPYTRSLQQEFNRALYPWIVDLYIRFPALFARTHYWSISPSTAIEYESVLPVGFNRDEEYLGPIATRIQSTLFPVDDSIKLAKSPEIFRYLTLLLLLSDARLGLISVWNPTFLLVLMDYLRKQYRQLATDMELGRVTGVSLDDPAVAIVNNRMIPDPGRARQVRAACKGKDFNWKEVWPGLQVISLWDDGMAAGYMEDIRKLFPGVHLQGKGLLATEGVVTIPFGRKDEKVLSCRSHAYEFREIISGKLLFPEQLKEGSRYSVILTTGGGLYRYELEDIVEVTGFYRSLPVLKFFGRDGSVVDLTGEKMYEHHVSRVLDSCSSVMDVKIDFALLIGVSGKPAGRYVMVIDTQSTRVSQMRLYLQAVEDGLLENYHYRHAREMGQLEYPGLLYGTGENLEKYIALMRDRGLKEGDIKLSSLMTGIDPDTVFSGMWLKP
jgi:hypothetical protein